MAPYGMYLTISGSLEEAKARVVAALKAQGFGILTEIDVQKTLKEKIGADFEPYLILGACNPHLAHQALTADRAIGLLLPCNVVLRSTGGAVEISILDPEVMFSVVEPQTQKALAALPGEAKSRLEAALAALKLR
ncbi:MAG: DUF302 domain-containing protein [Candidatus Latescibacteria bacterium]|nr:DUF302 domain-containing protein [Candidatus Latescibacterota bacterium]